MLSEVQKNRFSLRAKEEVKKLLNELKIQKLNDNNIGELQDILDVKVSGLVTLNECENQPIDKELLHIYDLITDIILDNEEDLDFLNKLFLDL